MASSYQGYARPTGFQELTATNAALVRQQEQDNRKIEALEKQKAELDKRADKSEKDLERKLTKQEEQRNKNYNFVENVSYDNRVQAIKTNQKIEEQSYRTLAEEDRKKAEDLMQFSQSLTDSLGKFHEKWKDNQMQAGYHAAAMEGLPSDSVVDQVEGSNKLYEQHLEILDIGETLWKQGSPVNVVNNVKRSSAWWEYGAAQYRAEAAGDAFQFWIKDYLRDSNAIEPHEVQEALEKGREKFLKMNNLYGYSSDFLNPTLKKMGLASKELMAKAQLGRDYVNSQDMVQVDQSKFHQNKDIDSLNRYAASLMMSFDINGQRLKGGFKNVLKKDLGNTDIFSDEEFEELMNSPTSDQPNKTWKERHKVWYDELVLLRQKDATTRQNIRSAANANKGEIYLSEIQDVVSKLQKQGKRLTEAQLAKYQNGWDRGWGPMPPYLANYLTQETAEDKIDADLIAGFQERIKNNQPVYEEEVDKITDFALHQAWKDIAKQSVEESLPDDILELAKKRIDTHAQTYLDQEKTGLFNKREHNIIMERGMEDFHRFYKEELPNSKSKREAMNRASRRVMDIIDDGKTYKDYKPVSKGDYGYAQKKADAQFAIETFGETYIKEAVIPGIEEDLKIYRDSNGKIVPKIFEDLSSTIAMSPAQFANYQLVAAGDKPIKSEIDEEIEKLSPKAQELLLLHPSKSRVMRAKIEELKKDGNITYNDVGYLIEEVHDFYATEKGQKQLDKEVPLGYVSDDMVSGDKDDDYKGTFVKSEEIVIGPDTKQAGKRKRGRPEGEVPYVETKQFKNVVSNLGELLPELFGDTQTKNAVINDIVTTIEKRKEEVKKQNRPNKRKK